MSAAQQTCILVNTSIFLATLIMRTDTVAELQRDYHTAVQASSCFPGALPARWIRTSQFHFPSQDKGIRLPQMALVDGGVYDNMGEQYLMGIDDRQRRGDGFPNGIFI